MTIVAKKPSKLYVISAADYERCFEEMPEVTLPLPSAPSRPLLRLCDRLAPA